MLKIVQNLVEIVNYPPNAQQRFAPLFTTASLCPWERHFKFTSYCGQAVYPLWLYSLTKGLQ